MVIKLKDGNIIRKIKTEYGVIDLENADFRRVFLNGKEMPVKEALTEFCERYGMEVEGVYDEAD